MKKTISVLLLLLVVLGSGYAPSGNYKWIFTTKRCSNNSIPAYSSTSTGASRTPRAGTGSTPITDTSSIPNTRASSTLNIDTSRTPTTRANSTPNTGTSITSGSWNRLNSILLSVYDAKIVEGDRHLLVIESDKKHEENIRQLICDYWKE